MVGPDNRCSCHLLFHIKPPPNWAAWNNLYHHCILPKLNWLSPLGISRVIAVRRVGAMDNQRLPWAEESKVTHSRGWVDAARWLGTQLKCLHFLIAWQMGSEMECPKSNWWKWPKQRLLITWSQMFLNIASDTYSSGQEKN